MAIPRLLKWLLLPQRLLYRRIAGAPTSDSDRADDDADDYSEDEEPVHGSFVYFAFLMLGNLCLSRLLICRTGHASSYVLMCPLNDI